MHADGRSRQGGSYLGPSYSDTEIRAFLETHGYPHTDADTNVDTCAAAHLESMTLTYDFTIDFSPTMELLTDPPVKDCASRYVADGTYVDSEDVDSSDVYVTMRGTWKLEFSTCPCDPTETCALDFRTTDLIWYDVISKESYHTFHFDENLTYLNTWVAHKNASQVEPAPNPRGIQFYIYDMFATYDDGVRIVDHTESYLDPDTYGSEFTSTLHVEFNAP